MKIRELRENRGWTQDELSTQTRDEEGRPRVSQATISQLEAGLIRSPRIATISALAAALGVPLADLLDDLSVSL